MALTKISGDNVQSNNFTIGIATATTVTIGSTASSNGTLNINGNLYNNGILVNLTSVDYGLVTGTVDSSTDYGGLS